MNFAACAMPVSISLGQSAGAAVDRKREMTMMSKGVGMKECYSGSRRRLLVIVAQYEGNERVAASDRTAPPPYSSTVSGLLARRLGWRRKNAFVAAGSQC